MSLPSADPLVRLPVRLPNDPRAGHPRLPRGGRAGRSVEQPIGVAVRIAADAVAGVRGGAHDPSYRWCQDSPVAPSNTWTTVLSPQSSPSSTAGMAAQWLSGSLAEPDDSLLVAGLVP